MDVGVEILKLSPVGRVRLCVAESLARVGRDGKALNVLVVPFETHPRHRQGAFHISLEIVELGKT